MAKKSAKKPAKTTAKKAVKSLAKKSAKQPAKKAATKPEQKVSRYAEVKMNPVVHFEMPVDQPERATKFYADAFGWKANHMGAELGDYIVMHTGETSEDGMIKEKGIINGGFFRKQKTSPAHHPNVVIAVYNMDEHIRKVEEAGGKIIGQPEEIAGYGKTVSFYDTEGNRVAMIEPDNAWKERTA